MYLVQQVTNDSLQQQTLVLPDGTLVNLTMYYRPLQYGWFINSLVYGDFTLNGLRITNSPNMLYQWKHVIPFGLACFSTANREPSQQDDFLSGASKLYVLSASEVDNYSSFLSGATL